MRNTTSRMVAVGLAVWFLAEVSAGASWPQWAGPNRNWTTSEPSGTWPPQFKWSKNTGNSDSSPIIVGGKVYYTVLDGSNTRVYCIDAATGTQLWTDTTPGGRYGRNSIGDQDQYYGPLPTPACDGTQLFTLSVDGDLQSWNASTGAKGWGFNLYQQYGMSRRPNVGGGQRDYGYTTSPMLSGSNIIVEVGGNDGLVMTFRKSDGGKVSSWGSGYAGHSSGPTGPNGEIHLSLNKLWFNGASKSIDYTTDYGCNIATPAWSANYVVVSSGYNQSKTTCYDRNGNLKWTSSVFSTVCSPVIHESAGNVYMPGYGYSFNGCRGDVLDLSNGSKRSWSFGDSTGCCVTSDNRIVVFDSTLRLYDTSGNKLYEVNTGLGRQWSTGAFGEGYIVWKSRNQICCYSVGGGGGSPAIALSPTSLSFSATAGGANPAAQNVSVTNSGSGTLADVTTSISYGSGSNWLSVSRSGSGNSQTLANSVNIAGLAAGTYTATVSVYSTGASNSPQSYSVTLTVSAAPTLRDPENPSGTVSGLNVSYYELSSPSALPNFGSLTAYKTDTVSAIDYPSTDGNFATSGRADNVGAVFTGYVQAPSDGVYTFYTTSDDGSALYIGAQKVVDNDGLHGMQERSGSIGLRAGKHALRVEFFEAVGGAGLVVSWEGPGVGKQTIPASALFRVPTASPAIALSPSSLTFSATAGGANPAAQNVSVTNSGSGTLADVTTSISYGSGSNWLTVTRSGSGNSQTLANSVNISGLAAGTYTATVSVYSTGASNSPRTYTVTLSVTGGADSDSDGLPDSWETQYFGNPAACDPNADADSDGLTNREEYQRGTNPTDADSDDDGMSDGFEAEHGFDPLSGDQDGNGVPDGDDDWDSDGIANKLDSTPGSPTGGGGGGGGFSCAAGGTGAWLGLFILLGALRARSRRRWPA